jgi:hypothetical protein
VREGTSRRRSSIRQSGSADGYPPIAEIVLAAASTLGLEGVVSKKRSEAYWSREGGWVKTNTGGVGFANSGSLVFVDEPAEEITAA